MKLKQISIVLAAAVLAVALAACGNNAKPAATPAPTEAPAATPEPEQTGETATGEQAAPDPELSKTLEEIYKIKDPGLALATMAVDPNDAQWFRYYTGLDHADGIEAAVASEAMISAQAYSVILARVSDGTDASAVAEQIMNAVDPTKWVCVQADDIHAAASGNLVLVTMMDSALADAVTGQQLVDAFRQVMGGELSAELTRTVDLADVPHLG